MRPDSIRALVTGASGGIGEALAHHLVGQGARVLIAGRNLSRLEKLSHALGDSCLGIYSGDLTSGLARRDLARAADEHRINVLINAMGINELGLLMEQSPERIELLLDTNLTAPVQLTRELLPVLLDNVPSQVVNIGSAFGSIGHPGYAVYCAAKFGLRGFSETLRRELADSNVDVLYIAPRATRTAMNCAKATALNAALGNAEDSPERVAGHIADAMTQGRKRTYLGWPEKLFVRLNGLIPGLVDNAMTKRLATIKKYAQQTP